MFLVQRNKIPKTVLRFSFDFIRKMLKMEKYFDGKYPKKNGIFVKNEKKPSNVRSNKCRSKAVLARFSFSTRSFLFHPISGILQQNINHFHGIASVTRPTLHVIAGNQINNVYCFKVYTFYEIFPLEIVCSRYFSSSNKK